MTGQVVPGDVQRRMVVALSDVLTEARRSISKHGDQGHLPMGTGWTSEPLLFLQGVPVPHLLDAGVAARLATERTKARSQNEGGNGTITWWDILLEEVMEAAAEDDLEELRKELVQVGAVVLKMVEAIDRGMEQATGHPRPAGER